MIEDGEATYEAPGIIVLVQTARTTSEMDRGAIPKISTGHRPAPASSSGDAGRGVTLFAHYRRSVLTPAVVVLEALPGTTEKIERRLVA